VDYEQLTKDFMESMFLRDAAFRPIIDLSKGEMATMLYLVIENDHAIVGDIANRIALSSGRMAAVLKSLEKKELILKKQCREDRRQTIVSSTIKGQKLVKNHSEMVFGITLNLLKFLGDEDATAFVRINKRINEDFDVNKNY
jgi:DNA-binding MarR family transcriptional regulator